MSPSFTRVRISAFSNTLARFFLTIQSRLGPLLSHAHSILLDNGQVHSESSIHTAKEELMQRDLQGGGLSVILRLFSMLTCILPSRTKLAESFPCPIPLLLQPTTKYPLCQCSTSFGLRLSAPHLPCWTPRAFPHCDIRAVIHAQYIFDNFTTLDWAGIVRSNSRCRSTQSERR